MRVPFLVPSSKTGRKKQTMPTTDTQTDRFGPARTGSAGSNIPRSHAPHLDPAAGPALASSPERATPRRVCRLIRPSGFISSHAPLLGGFGSWPRVDMNEEGHLEWARLIRALAQTARASQETAGIGGGCCNAALPQRPRATDRTPPTAASPQIGAPANHVGARPNAGNLLRHRVDPRVVIAYRNMPFSAS